MSKKAEKPRKKQDDEDATNNAPAHGDACESNVGQPGKKKSKRECPDGYPDEQPPADEAGKP